MSITIDLPAFDDGKVICIAAARARFAVAKCSHRNMIVDEDLAEVECQDCGAKLNAVAMLARFASEESRWHRQGVALRELQRKLEEKQRCKCQHCGKMTRVRP